MTENKDKNYHTGHRDRLRKRYLENGVDALAEHEILELILFYSIPRVDTKPIAHRLIDIYGSLGAVLGASHESLVANGLTSSCAAHLKIINDAFSWISHKSIISTKAIGYNEMGKIFADELKNDKTERVVMLMLDSKDRIMGLETVCEGSFTSARFNTRHIAELCMLRQAAKIAFAHNHPAGNLDISMNDHAANHTIMNLCSYLDVQMLEHYIVVGDQYIGMLRFRNESNEMEGAVYLKNHGNHTEL